MTIYLGGAPPPVARSMPALSVTNGVLGGTLSVSATAANGDLIIILLGFRGLPILVPGIADAFWLDPAVFVFQAFGVPAAGQALTSAVGLPNSPAFVDTQLMWQAVSYDICYTSLGLLAPRGGAPGRRVPHTLTNQITTS